MARTDYSGRDHHPIPLNRWGDERFLSTGPAPDRQNRYSHRPGANLKGITMEHLRNLLQARRVDRDEAGASAVEYGLLVAGIAALIVAVVFLFGGMISGHVRRHLRHDPADEPAPAPTPPPTAPDRPHRLRPWSATPATRTTAETHFVPEQPTDGGDDALSDETRLIRLSSTACSIAGIAALVASVVFLLGGTVRDTLFDPGCDELAGHIATANGGGQGDCQDCSRPPVRLRGCRRSRAARCASRSRSPGRGWRPRASGRSGRRASSPSTG